MRIACDDRGHMFGRGHVFEGDARPGDPCRCGAFVRGWGVRSMLDRSTYDRLAACR